MAYHIQSIELYVRENVGRMAFSLGREKTADPLINPISHVRMIVRDDAGNETFGTSGDRLSVRWLDKRSGRSKIRKLRELVALIGHARRIYLDRPEFESPFDKWLAEHRRIMEQGRSMDQEDLTTSFASALMERAMVDAVCRLEGRSVFEMFHADRLGFRPGKVHPELKGIDLTRRLPAEPRTLFNIRHTVGSSDPLTPDEIAEGERINDGLPQALSEYVEDDGVTHFKVKISGDPEGDLDRLRRIWDVVPKTPETLVTMDANEAYRNVDRLGEFMQRLRRDLPGLFDHVALIEQPLPRGLTLDGSTASAIRRVNEIKPLVIDEADGTLDAFKRALSIGYAGVSHKNCKGFFKSLTNRALMAYHAEEHDRELIQSAEDLQLLPIVPLQQDQAALSILNLSHCERNGHHYNYGLSMLSDRDKRQVARHHRDLYVKRKDEWFLDVRAGQIWCPSVQCPGFGVREEPDFASMEPMDDWLKRREAEA